MEWLAQVVFLSCALCALGSRSPRPPSSPSGLDKGSEGRSALGPMPGDIVEGDIVLDENTAALLRGGARNAMANVKKWPNGVVPYVLDSSVDDYLRQQIDIGIAEYHKYTCLRFVKRTYEKNYIRIVKPGSGCNSMVGVVGNGEQILNMGPGCEYVGLVLHEFGHAIGYFHEHNRPDRDNVIEVLWDNVQDYFKSAFKKYKFEEADTQGYPYDLTSIMHYENSAFGKTGFCKTTIIVKNDPSYEIRPVYERGVFSPQDIRKINKLYGCTTTQLPDIVKPGTGNPDPNNCKCEDKHDKCPEWKNNGECGNNAGWMSSNCPKSCRVCGEPDSDCKDEMPVACEEWAKRYECSNNPIWMNKNCPKSCGVCGTAVPPTQDPNLCEDSNSGCPGWASSGECSANFDWMHKNCKKSCRMCGERPSNCADKYPQACEDWEKKGECQANPTWMGKNCPRSCNNCGGGTPQPPTAPPQSPPPPTPPPNTPPPPTQSPGNCIEDVYPQHCPTYKSYGWCTKSSHADYMKEVCYKTCGYCAGSGNCKDVYPQHCPDYKKNGLCCTGANEAYCKEVCKFTCGYCS